MHRSATRVILIGAALLAGLSVGVVLVVTNLYAQHRGFGGAIDPRLVDGGALAANGALLFALLKLNRRDPESNEGTEGDA